MQIRTIKVNNISLAVSERDIREFFSFSGDIQYVEMRRSVFYQLAGTNVICKPFKEIGVIFGRESESTQLAYVTFKDSQGADTAVLLSVCLFTNDIDKNLLTIIINVSGGNFMRKVLTYMTSILMFPITE